MTVLAIDHGLRKIGVAVSDATATLARPLVILKHIAREIDARNVLDLALKHEATTIVVGQSLDENGEPNAAGRNAGRFADELRRLGPMTVVLWDESFSTKDALAMRIQAGLSRKRRNAADDALAAAVILQSYLDAAGPPDISTEP